ncbi:MAG: SDR family oxidoreductase [Candidatus Methylomirabilis sp.]|nr:SDR family oxidoreductase [Deltaproteobacteria bacterium]
MAKTAGLGVLVTGANGYIGRLTVEALAADRSLTARVVALDVRETPKERRLEGVEYVVDDIRSPELAEILASYRVDAVVHLASIVTPGRNSDPEFEYAVDVLGTRNVLDACLAAGVRRLVVTSSGAAYGYHADNPVPLAEDAPLRGNESFPYSRHKRLVENMLAQERRDHPALAQLVLRPGTILGEGTANQITALFKKRVVLGVRGSETPFVFIWDRDVVRCILRGLREDLSGVYNLAGDGVVTLREIARMQGRPYLAVPPSLLRGALAVLKRLGLTRYGPEQVDFLRYRPVLANRRLKEAFGYTPERTSREVIEAYLAAERRRTGRAA